MTDQQAQTPLTFAESSGTTQIPEDTRLEPVSQLATQSEPKPDRLEPPVIAPEGKIIKGEDPKRKWLRRTFLTLGLLLAMVASGVAGYFVYGWLVR